MSNSKIKCTNEEEKHLNQKYPQRTIFALLILFCSSPALSAQCPVVCAQTIDYQQDGSLLNFSRLHYTALDHVHRASNSNEKNGISRHNFDIVLTRDKDQLVLFDQEGTAHYFSDDQLGSNAAIDDSSGQLIQDSGRFIWTNDQGIEHVFNGSYMAQMRSKDETLNFQYDEQQRLSSVINSRGASLQINYTDGNINTLIQPDGTVVELPPHTCSISQSAVEDHCTSRAESNFEFSPDASNPNTVAVDIRPTSCQSYFTDYYGTERGYEIEQAIELHPLFQNLQSTVRSYPIVDFIGDERLVVLRSRDLASPSFNNPDVPNALLHRLMRDGNDIQDNFLTPMNQHGQVTATENGISTTIYSRQVDNNVVLNIVIRDGIASPAHWQQIATAREQLLEKYGVTLEVVIIP